MASLKLSLFFRRALLLRDFPDGAGCRGSAGHGKGMSLWCSGLSAQGRRGAMLGSAWPEQAAEARSRAAERELLTASLGFACDF